MILVDIVKEIPLLYSTSYAAFPIYEQYTELQYVFIAYINEWRSYNINKLANRLFYEWYLPKEGKISKEFDSYQSKGFYCKSNNKRETIIMFQLPDITGLKRKEGIFLAFTYHTLHGYKLELRKHKIFSKHPFIKPLSELSALKALNEEERKNLGNLIFSGDVENLKLVMNILNIL